MPKEPKESAKKTSRLRQFNNALSFVVICLSAYIVVLPLLPNITYKINKVTGNKPPLVIANTPGTTQKTPPPAPAENTLVIPSINLQKTIYDGASIANLSKGVWHRPLTSSPDQGHNTVLVGHRFGYNGDGVFYHLDKVNTGDKIYVYWSGKKHTYTVTQKLVVKPTDTQVEAKTSKSILTMYTCTPLWTFSDRLVVIAEEEGA